MLIKKSKNKKYRRWPLLFFLIGFGVFILLYTHNVKTSLTIADHQAIETLLSTSHDPALFAKKPQNYEDEIDQIAAVQRAVLTAVPIDQGIPLNMNREPTALLARGKGLCYDRSRLIEKTLEFLGYETRHVSIYEKQGSAVKSLITPGISSHAVSEVMTSKGWLVIDSNKMWLSLNHNSKPVSIKKIKNAAGKDAINWLYPDAARSPIYDSPFIYILGLFSRHGRFYEPMTPIPDINWPQFTQNLEELL